MSKKTPDRCSGMGFLKPHDEHNAYYILTPQRMEKIMEFADAVEGQISLVFYDEKLFAAVRREMCIRDRGGLWFPLSFWIFAGLTL